MFSSMVLTFVFTVVYVVTGGYALVRLALIVSGESSGEDRLAELCHLLMSLAMIAMAWGTGDGGLARTLQIGVFAGFAVWFLARALLGGRGHGRAPGVLHASASAAMVWMVAAMPLIMGMPMPAGGGDGDGGGHAGHGGHSAAAGEQVAGAAGVPAPGWVVAVTVAFAAVLLAGAVFWAARLWTARLWAARAAAPAALPVPALVGAGGGATAVEARHGLTALAGPRQDLVCHLLMSLGMAGMLVAML
ncbi:DUF5134 domain-containing protein [Actinomycetes bacterium KLBMP 9759]